MFELIVEQKIVAAAERGELSDLPGQGAPLRMDDDTLIPVELRMVYRILRNAGFVPPELEALRAIGCIERCIENLSEGRPRSRALRKLQFLRLRLEKSGRPQNLPRYAQKLLARLEERCVDERCFDKFDDCG